MGASEFSSTSVAGHQHEEASPGGALEGLRGALKKSYLREREPFTWRRWCGTRALGIDPGTSSFDVCCITDGDEIVLEESLPTQLVAQRPEALFDVVQRADPEVMVGPSAMGLPCKHVSQLSAVDIAYATLAKNTEVDIAIRRFITMLQASPYSVYFVPSVIQLSTVPTHRKTNKVDMGTADKTCIAALALWDHAHEWAVPYREGRFIVVELGFGFNAALAVDGGQIVDGIGGTRFPVPGFLTMGAMDLEFSHLLGRFSADQLGLGGASYIASGDVMTPEAFAQHIDEPPYHLAWDTLVDGVVKAVAMETAILEDHAREILLSGRLTRVHALYPRLCESLETRFNMPIRRVTGFSSGSKEAAQGAALIANGLGDGVYAELVDAMRLREAKGTVLDYLYWPSFNAKALMTEKMASML
jgi:predicted butyrate kinase (DUF1464 family)